MWEWFCPEDTGVLPLLLWLEAFRSFAYGTVQSQLDNAVVCQTIVDILHLSWGEAGVLSHLLHRPCKTTGTIALFRELALLLAVVK